MLNLAVKSGNIEVRRGHDRKRQPSPSIKQDDQEVNEGSEDNLDSLHEEHSSSLKKPSNSPSINKVSSKSRPNGPSNSKSPSKSPSKSNTKSPEDHPMVDEESKHMQNENNDYSDYEDFVNGGDLEEVDEEDFDVARAKRQSEHENREYVKNKRQSDQDKLNSRINNLDIHANEDSKDEVEEEFWNGAPENWDDSDNEFELLDENEEPVIKRDDFDQHLIDNYYGTFESYNQNFKKNYDHLKSF